VYARGVATPANTEDLLTQPVAKIVADWVKPLLTAAERDCLDYLVARTISAGAGETHKARDAIALEQFEHGQTMGHYLRNLGTGLGRPTIKKALDNLEAKDLIEGRYSCPACLWEPTSAEMGPAPSKGVVHCPRCRKPLVRFWALAEVTPAKIVGLLNAHDPKSRHWSWDDEHQMPRFEEDPDKAEARRRSEEDIREEAIRLYRLLWFRDLVEEAVKMAEAQMKAGHKVSITRRINNFYLPVWQLQEKYNNPALIKYSLQQTIDGPALRNPDTHGWVKYLAKVCANNVQRFRGGGVVPGTNAAQTEATSLKARERAVAEMLHQAYDLNRTGEVESARVLLSDILAQTKALAPLFDGDEEHCERALREAFKQGSSDITGIRPNPHAAVDYYPEWTWPK